MPGKSSPSRLRAAMRFSRSSSLTGRERQPERRRAERVAGRLGVMKGFTERGGIEIQAGGCFEQDVKARLNKVAIIGKDPAHTNCVAISIVLQSTNDHSLSD